jgi:hypothetical protein
MANKALSHDLRSRFVLRLPHPVSWNAARPGQGFSGADIRSIGSHQREGLPSGSVDSAKCLLRCDPCMTRRRQKDGPPGVEARRPCTTAWCDQISTPAENQLLAKPTEQEINEGPQTLSFSDCEWERAAGPHSANQVPNEDTGAEVPFLQIGRSSKRWLATLLRREPLKAARSNS